MGHDNYHQIDDALQRRASFDGHSASAHRYPNGHYRVYSYATPILSVDPSGVVVFFDNRFYSVTTSRLQAMIREAFPEVTKGGTDRVVYAD